MEGWVDEGVDVGKDGVGRWRGKEMNDHGVEGLGSERLMNEWRSASE